MPKGRGVVTALLAAAAIVLANLAASPAHAVSSFVGVILPDTSSSTRWETKDRPFLAAAFKAVNVDVDIQNANGDPAAFKTIAESMLAKGAKVLILVNLDSQSARSVQDRAKKLGVPTIDYDRLTLNGSASYYISFDNVATGRVLGQAVKSCLNRAGKKKNARIVYLNGSADDNNATRLREGYDAILRPLIKSGAYVLVDDSAVPGWDAVKGGIIFEQQLSKSGGKLDAVVAANDGLGLAVVSVLKKYKLNGSTCVTGQDASVDALRAVLQGDMTTTVYKAIKAEADNAAALAVSLLEGHGTTLAKSRTNNGSIDVPSILLKPMAIPKEKVASVVKDGFQKRADVCKGLEVLCKRYRV